MMPEFDVSHPVTEIADDMPRRADFISSIWLAILSEGWNPPSRGHIFRDHTLASKEDLGSLVAER
jgi:hypothetical protein